MAQELLPDNIRKRINVAAHVDPWQWNWYQYIDPDTGTSKFWHAKLEWWYDDVRHVRPKGVAIQPCEVRDDMSQGTASKQAKARDSDQGRATPSPLGSGLAGINVG